MRLMPAMGFLGIALGLAGCADGPSSESSMLPQTDRTEEVRVCQAVGLSDAGGDVLLGRVSAAVRSADGSLYVLDQIARRLYRFDRAGALQGSIGSPGSGPGEFQNPLALAPVPEGVAVWDQGTARVTVFSPSGAIVSETSFIPRSSPAGSPSVWRTNDGSWLFVDHGAPDIDVDQIRGGEVIRGRTKLLRWHHDAEEPWVEVAEVDGLESALYLLPSGRPGAFVPPLTGIPLFAQAGDGFWYADSRGDRIWRKNRDGEPLAEILLGLEGTASSEEDRDALLESYERASPELGRVLEGLEFPARHPTMAGLRSSEAGDVWILLENPREHRSEWLIYSESGDPMFRLSLPERQSLEYIQGDTLLVVARSELGEHSVAVSVLSADPDACNRL